MPKVSPSTHSRSSEWDTPRVHITSLVGHSEFPEEPVGVPSAPRGKEGRDPTGSQAVSVIRAASSAQLEKMPIQGVAWPQVRGQGMCSGQQGQTPSYKNAM